MRRYYLLGSVVSEQQFGVSVFDLVGATVTCRLGRRAKGYRDCDLEWGCARMDICPRTGASTSCTFRSQGFSPVFPFSFFSRIVKEFLKNLVQYLIRFKLLQVFCLFFFVLG
jgi:hypothetical protein